MPTPVLDVLRSQVLEALDPLDQDTDWLFDGTAFESTVRAAIAHVAAGDGTIQEALEAEMLGWGPLDRVWRRRDVDELSVNGPDDVWISVGGRRERVPVMISSSRIEVLLDAWLARSHTQLSHARPLRDASLPDGARMLAKRAGTTSSPGGSFTLRRQSAVPRDLDRLVADGMLDATGAILLQAMLDHGCSVLVAGSLGVGKTTLLGALLLALPAERRVEIIEDVRELPRPEGRNVSDSLARSDGSEGRGQITFRDLLRAALRNGADTAVLGEVRGPEAADLLDAMMSFRGGCLGSIHGDDANSALARFAGLALQGGAVTGTVLSSVARAVDYVLYCGMAPVPGNPRRLLEVARPALEDGALVATPVLRWRPPDQLLDRPEEWECLDYVAFEKLGVGLRGPR